jgi:hypothetical protein
MNVGHGVLYFPEIEQSFLLDDQTFFGGRLTNIQPRNLDIISLTVVNGKLCQQFLPNCLGRSPFYKFG